MKTPDRASSPAADRLAMAVSGLVSPEARGGAEYSHCPWTLPTVEEAIRN